MGPAHYKSAKHKAVLPNGRDRKAPLRFEDCWAKITVSMVIHPAWRHLSASAKDVLIICIIKAGNSAYHGNKDLSGRPVFSFVYSEAKQLLHMPDPTFKRVLRELEDKGHIAINKPGGILHGKGIPALYHLTDKWKEWVPPPVDLTNIGKARTARKLKSSVTTKI